MQEGALLLLFFFCVCVFGWFEDVSTCSPVPEMPPHLLFCIYAVRAALEGCFGQYPSQLLALPVGCRC